MRRRLLIPALLVWWFGSLAGVGTLCAQGSSGGCEPLLRFQMRTMPAAPQSSLPLSAGMVHGTMGREPLSVVALAPFSLATGENNTLSLLVVVWYGGLPHSVVDRFAASLHKEERLHLRLAVLTRAGVQSGWTDDRVEQRKLLDAASVETSASPADEPGYVPTGSDAVVLQKRWNQALQVSMEDLIRQPGKLAVLELLPPNPLRPPLTWDHWRIPPDRDFTGESQVHTVAALGTIPVYRAHHDTPALQVLIPFGDASTPAPFGATMNSSPVAEGQRVLLSMQGMAIRPALPPASMRFADLGGHDVYEAEEALPVMLADLRETYTVTVRAPRQCSPQSLLPLRLAIDVPRRSVPPRLFVPQWLLMGLLGRSAAQD